MFQCFLNPDFSLPYIFIYKHDSQELQGYRDGKMDNWFNLRVLSDNSKQKDMYIRRGFMQCFFTEISQYN